jgi:SAM-dependent methyltransferase
MPDYSSPLYWQERYAHDPTSVFDWYLTYDELRPFIGPILAARRSGDTEIFIPGCGNSTLGARLYADGYTNISNTDISSVVISQAKDRYADMTEMDFCVLDACDMKEELPEPCFDIVRVPPLAAPRH